MSCQERVDVYVWYLKFENYDWEEKDIIVEGEELRERFGELIFVIRCFGATNKAWYSAVMVKGQEGCISVV